jgi:hypothetical protein
MSLELTTRVNADGTICIPVPASIAQANTEVLVTVQPLVSKGHPMDREEWLAFLGRVCGSIDDPTFERHPQGEFEQRDSLE